MHLIRLFVIFVQLGLILTSCNINPSKKAQTRQYANGGLSSQSHARNALVRSYDYYEGSKEDLIKRMRNP